MSISKKKKAERIRIVTRSPEETVALGRKLAACLKKDALIALCGDLGSGKTTLVKGIAEGLGIDPDRVNSPSFVLIREYRGKRKQLFHADFYRLDDAGSISALGIEEYFPGGAFPGSVFVMEWAKKAEDFLPEDYLLIEIKFTAKEKRTFEITGKGDFYKDMVDTLKRRCGKMKS